MIKNPIERWQNHYQPDTDYSYALDPTLKVDQRKLATLVGLVAFLLPFAMLLGTWTGTCFYHSISHFYYSQVWGDVVVGALVFVGAFLFAYQGASRSERRVATLASPFALGIALLPTTGSGCSEDSFHGRALVDFGRSGEASTVVIEPAPDASAYFELFQHVEYFHYGSAGILFAFLAYFALVVFTRVRPDQRAAEKKLTGEKLTRNVIYCISGGVIVLSMAAMGLDGLVGLAGWDERNLTFWFEAAALWAFGVSWAVKGRLFGTVLRDAGD